MPFKKYGLAMQDYYISCVREKGNPHDTAVTIQKNCGEIVTVGHIPKRISCVSGNFLALCLLRTLRLVIFNSIYPLKSIFLINASQTCGLENFEG